MRLSEAIRKGAALHEQGFLAFFKNLAANGEPYICTCALGAALEGAGVLNWQQYSDLDISTPIGDILRDTFPQLDNPVKHPAQVYHYPVYQAIMSLNDAYKWTREEIADWLEKEGL